MKAVLIVLGAALLAMVSLFLIFAAFFSSAPPPAGEVRVPEVSTGTSSTPPAVRGPDIGRGVPNGPCSTDRLGASFERDGVTYTCSGPLPYRWRKA